MPVLEDPVRYNTELKCTIHQWYIEDYYNIDLDKFATLAGLVPNPEGCYVIRGYVSYISGNYA